MADKTYRFQKTEDRRWGIYLQDRLLATIGSYEACKSIGDYLSTNLSHADVLKAAIAYKKAVNRNLTAECGHRRHRRFTAV